MADTPPLATCPICGHDTVPLLRPFCSKRCADIDLGRWFSGQYRTPSRRSDGDTDEEEEPGR